MARATTECTKSGTQFCWPESTAALNAAADKSLLDEPSALRLDDQGNLPGALKVTALSRLSTANWLRAGLLCKTMQVLLLRTCHVLAQSILCYCCAAAAAELLWESADCKGCLCPSCWCISAAKSGPHCTKLCRSLGLSEMLESALKAATGRHFLLSKATQGL